MFPLAVSADYILGQAPLNQEASLSAYYGAGAGIYMIGLFGVGALSPHAHAVGGLEYGLPNSDLSIFTELSLGIGTIIAFGGNQVAGTGFVGPYIGGRLGVLIPLR